MAKTRKLTVELLGDVKGLRQSFQQASKETQTLGQSVEGFAKKALLPATAALTALTAGAVKSVKAAADFDETINKVGVTFGDAADQILKFSEGSAQALGQSQQQALDAASSFALFGKSAGLTGNQLVGFSTELVKLATDLASIQNTSVDEAISAIGSGLRGEAEPLRRFNILLDDFTLRQEAMRLGLVATTKQALTPQQKVLAAQAVILRQGAYAMDDFSNTSGGLSNQQKILQAELSDVTREIGQRLLPFALKLVEAFRGMVKFVADNSGVFFALGVTIAGVSAAVIAINAAYKVHQAVALATKAVNKILESSFVTLKGSMGVVAGALVAAGAIYAIVKGRKQDYKGATDQLTEALKLEAGAQREAVAQLINTDKNFRLLVENARKAGISTDQLTKAIENGGVAYDEVKRKIEDLYYVQGLITGGRMSKLVGILEGMRKQVLRTAEGFELAGNSMNGFAASLQLMNRLRAFAQGGIDAAKSLAPAVAKVGGGVSKLRENVDKLRDSFKTVRDAARDQLTNARKEFDDFAKSVSSSLRSAFNFNTAFEQAQSQGGSFLSALQDQARKVRDFSVLVNRLVAAGASEAVVEQVLGAGVDAGSRIANELLSTVGGVATANRLAADVAAMADTVGQNAARAFRQTGIDTATALVAGIESVLRNYQIRLRSRGLSERQLERLRRNFAADVNFQFIAAGREVPALAEGGITTGPTLALIGEAGPEAVIPLDRMGDMGGGGDTYVTINVQGADPNAVVNALRKYLANTGPIPIRVTG